MRTLVALTIIAGLASLLPAYGGPSETKSPAEKVLEKARRKGDKLYHERDYTGCIKVFNAELEDARKLLPSRPELQLLIQVELRARHAKVEDEAWRLIELTAMVQHSIRNSGPLPNITTRAKWSVSQITSWIV